jgi:exosortase
VVSDPANESANDSTLSVRTRTIVLAIAAALLLWAFASYFRIQWRWVLSDPKEWAHTLLAPLGAVWLVWMNRGRLAGRPAGASRIGPLLVVAGSAWFVLSTTLAVSIVNSHNSRGLAVVLVLAGIAATILGRGSWRILWFPALYLLVFGQAIGSRVLAPVTMALQGIAADWGYHLVGMFGFTASRSGTVISVLHDGDWSPVNVAEACSGIRMLPAVLCAAVPIGWWILDRVWSRLAFLAATVLLAIVFNALRIVFMAVLATQDSRILEGDLHGAISDLWTLPVLVVALFVAWALVPFNREESLPDDAPAPPPPPPLRWRGGLAACSLAIGLVLVGGLALRVTAATLGIEAEKREAPLRQPLSTLPTRLGEWRRVGEDRLLDSQVVEVLGTPHYLERTYALDLGDGEHGASTLRVHIAFYSGDPDESPHVPEVCWVGQGMSIDGPAEIRPLRLSIPGVRIEEGLENLDTGEPYPIVDLEHPVTRISEPVALPVGELALRISRFVAPTDPGSLQLGGYFFIANGRLTPRATDVRSLAFQLYQRYAYWMKVEFDATIPRGTGEREAIDAYVARVESLLSSLLPELMKRLPDWPALEREGRAD